MTSGSRDTRDTWADDPAWRRLLAGEILARMTAADGDGPRRRDP